MLVSEILDRATNVWLYPAGRNRPAFDTLQTSINSSVLTIDTNQRQTYGADGLIQIGTELIRYSRAQIDTPSAGITRLTIPAGGRGWLESAAAAHTAGDLIELDPEFYRVGQFNALVAILRQLYGWGLYNRVVTSALTVSDPTPGTLTAGTLRLVSVLLIEPGTSQPRRLKRGRDYEVWSEYSTPKISFYDGYAGQALQVVYATDYSIPAAESDDLSTVTNPLPIEVQEGLPMAIAGYLLQGKDIPRLMREEIVRALAEQGANVPAGIDIQVGQALINQFKSQYLAPELRRLRDLDPPRIKWVA